MEDAHAYYERVVLHYVVGDIMHLLDSQEKRSGLLLAPVMNGIDMIGGTIDGFEKGTSRRRSRNTMVNHLDCSERVARFLYDAVRCGITHEGTAKQGLVFFAEYGRLNRDSLIYRDDEGWLYLDTVLLAERFITAAKEIWDKKRELIAHLPSASNSGHSQLASDESIPVVSDFLRDLAEEAAAQETVLIDGLYRRSNLTSMSLFTPDCYFNDAFRLPTRSEQGSASNTDR